MARFTVRFSLRTLLLITAIVNALAAIAVTCIDARQRNRDAALTMPT